MQARVLERGRELWPKGIEGMDDVMILYTTWPDAETALAFASAAVEAGLAACANVLAPMTAVYRWEGVVELQTETPMLLKTTVLAAEALRDRLIAEHPYKVPCVVAFSVDSAASNPAFIQWIGEQMA